MAVGFTFSFICFSSLSAFLQEFPLPFASVFSDYQSFCFAGLSVVTCGSPFSSPLSARSLLFRDFAAFLAVHLHESNFLVGFSILCQLSSSVLSPPSRDSITLLVCANCFWLLLRCLRSSTFSLFFYFCIHRSRFHGFVSFCSSWLRVSLGYLLRFPFVFPRLCAILSSSLPVLSPSLSFFLRWFPAEFSGLCSLFSFPVRSLDRSLLGFLRLCLFLFCAFGSLPCDYPTSSLVT